jgi:hypothetical protein
MTKNSELDVERQAYELKSLMFSEITELFSANSNNQIEGPSEEINIMNINELSVCNSDLKSSEEMEVTV